MSGWVRGDYAISADAIGQTVTPDRRGWLRGPWAISERPEDAIGDSVVIAHHLTHVPTGYGAGRFGNADAAVDCAAALDALGDWSALLTVEAVRSASFFASAADVVRAHMYPDDVAPSEGGAA